MKQVFVLIFAVMALVSCSEAQEKPSSDGVINKVVSAVDFKAMITDDVQLIDVRTAKEFNGGKIDGATNIDFFGENFEAELNGLDKSKKTLVYCAVGGRSGKAAGVMKKLGFKEVYDLKGGYGNWPYK